jgi:hypothetical protein
MLSIDFLYFIDIIINFLLGHVSISIQERK